MNQIPTDLNTFLAALQTELQYPLSLGEVNVQDGSNRKEWIVRVVYLNKVQQFSIWMNPDNTWGWEKMQMGNFGFNFN